MRTELAVLGGGPGGYSAAFRAADLGIETTIVERRQRLGGVCLLEGCIPSKALVHVGRGLARAQELREWGVALGRPQIDTDALRRRKDKCIAELSGGLKALARQRKVRVLCAGGRLAGPRRLRLDGDGLDDDALDFEHLIIATGSAPARPGPFKMRHDRLMTSREALELPEVPRTLLVVGGAYVGLEMATTYARLGSRVTVVEMLDQLMPGVDADLVRPVRRALDALLAGIRLNARVERIDEAGDELAVTTSGEEGERTARYDRVLAAVGRRPCSDDLGLDDAGIETDDAGFIVVDDRQRTSREGILAVGDVVGEPLLAHHAFHQGTVAADVVAGRPAAFDRRAIPAVIFTDPEVAWVGTTEAAARAAGRKVDVARYPWSASGRAHAVGRTDGLTKLLFDPDTTRLIGAGIVGSDCGELIAECALAIETGCKALDLAETVHPHPTLGETVSGAAAVQLGLATEVGPRR
jgi:dihydrolipoamide dehydrogenase